MNEELANMDVWKEKVQQDINEIKSNQNQMKNEITNNQKDIQQLQTNDKLQDVEISNVKATLREIKDDTNWIRRKITGAFITALITAVVAGVIGIAITKIF